MYIDSHAHITSDELFPEIDLLIAEAKQAGLTRILNICTDQSTLQRGLSLAKKEPLIWNAGATTPHDVEKDGLTDFAYFEAAAEEGSLVAVGETGLDYHYQHSPKALQQEYLKRYFALAMHANLPVIIHCRDAFKDLFTFADLHYKGDKPLLIHCFTGTSEEAKEAVQRGWYISMSGIVTFKNAIELQKTFEQIPLSQLLIETDAPYLAPTIYRGKMNKPHYIVETYKFAANLYNQSLEQITSQVISNFYRYLDKK